MSIFKLVSFPVYPQIFFTRLFGFFSPRQIIVDLHAMGNGMASSVTYYLVFSLVLFLFSFLFIFLWLTYHCSI